MLYPEPQEAESPFGVSFVPEKLQYDFLDQDRAGDRWAELDLAPPGRPARPAGQRHGIGASDGAGSARHAAERPPPGAVGQSLPYRTVRSRRGRKRRPIGGRSRQSQRDG